MLRLRFRRRLRLELKRMFRRGLRLRLCFGLLRLSLGLSWAQHTLSLGSA